MPLPGDKRRRRSVAQIVGGARSNSVVAVAVAVAAAAAAGARGGAARVKGRAACAALVAVT